jgi:ADP-heptose:LPS heptosyltransferase
LKVLAPYRIIISRTDSIGDVILTLPLCVWLKKQFPQSELVFLGRSYTKDIIACFDVVDKFLNFDDFSSLPTSERIARLKADCIIHVFPNREIAALSKKAKIPMRIGTAHRVFHLLTCNYRLNFSRKRSLLHEAQLNFELLKPLGLNEIPSFEVLFESLNHFNIPTVSLPTEFSGIDLSHTIILHPKSQGSAVEWPLEKYIELAQGLVQQKKTVIFTGTVNEGKEFSAILPVHPQIIDSSGKLNLKQLILLISSCDALVACSTGPYHIAGISGIKAIGLFSPRKPIHPGRWRALGDKSVALVFDSSCSNCRKGKACSCIENISVQSVLSAINEAH